jgi:CDP-diglyceride synthetase
LTDAFVFLHTFGARALVAFAVLLGIWGAYGYFRNAQVSGGFRASYLIMAGLTALQGLVGLGLFVAGQRPHTLLHLVYGIFAVLFLPGAYLWAHGGSKRREAVILAAAAWIVAVAYFRGIATG